MPKKKVATKAQIRKALKKKKTKRPLWKGPEVDGVTQSLLSRFLVCRERFRLLTIEGLQPAPTFNHRIEYGSMWHILEEYHAQDKPVEGAKALLEYAKGLCKKFPLQQDQVLHWYEICKIQFPIYAKYWEKHPDVKNREPLLQEVSFAVPYELPSGRVALLRGKWDSVDLIGKGRNAAIYLQENKSKGDIKEEQLKRQLGSGFDLQTMTYLTALTEWWPGTLSDELEGKQYHLGGIRYNVIRRPLAGGRHSIRQHKPTKAKPQGESLEEFYERLGGLIAGEPEFFFMRWKIEITPSDLERFRRECLDPLLEQLWDWWEWMGVSHGQEPWREGEGSHVHFRYPYNVYNTLLEGNSGELDEYLNTGSKLGLVEAETLFGELD